MDPIPTAHRIPRISSKAAPLFFDEFYLPARPVIITGLVRAWPAHHRWTIDFLKDVLGARIHTFRYEDGATVKLPVGEYLDALLASDRDPDFARGFPALPSATERLPYMRHFGPLGGGFLTDYAIASLFPDPDRYNFSSFLFCGVPGTKTNCHYDWTHNFVGMVRGTKHVTLLPPGAEQEMAVDDDLRGRMAVGKCDYFHDPADLPLDRMHEHPVFAGCKAVYHAPISDGDVVFFPAYWYHYFHNVTGSISVTTQTCPIE